MSDEQPSRQTGGRTRPRAARTVPDERRRQLLDAAERMLIDGGSDALRMDAVARAGGVSRPVVYEHFGDRDGLVVALLDRHAERTSAAVAAAVSPGQPFSNELRAATHAYLLAARTGGPAMRALVSAERLSPTIEAARRRYWGAAATHWAQRYRHHRPLPEVDAFALATAHLAALASLAGLCIEGRLDVVHATDLHVRSTLAALDAVADDAVADDNSRLDHGRMP